MKGIKFMLLNHNQIGFYAFFLQDKKIIVTNAFLKKQQKLPRQEKEKALKYMKDYIKRNEQGTYYE
jgi:phage-related protein